MRTSRLTIARAALITASFFFVPLLAQAVLYAPGETLDPACGPTEASCGIANIGIGTVGAGTIGQVPYYAANGTLISPSPSLTILSNGNVGIGTTNPTSPFEVNGDIRITSNSGGRLFFSDGASQNSAIVSGSGILNWSDLNFQTGGLISFQTGNGVATTTRMTLTNAGFLGIGTAAPGFPLTVSKNQNTTTFITVSNTDPGVNSVAAVAGVSDSTLFFLQANSTGALGSLSAGTGTNRPKGVALYTDTGATGGLAILARAPTGIITFHTGGSSAVPRVIIDAAGNVGMGTSSPQGKLDVSGSSASTVLTTFDGNRALSIINTNSTSNNSSGVDFRTNDANGLLTTGAKVMGVYTSHAANAVSGDLAFLTRNASTVGEVMRITSLGNVGIGTSSPAQKLEVVGTIRQSGCVTAGTLSANTSGDIICTPSSLRFKDNIESVGAGLSEIVQLRPVSYNFKPELDMGPGIHYGFIAEEVASVTPAFATYDASGAPYGLDTSAILAASVNAIKELAYQVGGFAQSITTAVVNATTGNFTNINGQQLCLDGTCVTGSQLRQLLQQSGQ